MPKAQVRFVHAADLHIDSRFVARSGAPEAVRRALLESTYRAFRNLIELCVRRQVDFIVIAGDVFDSGDRGIRAQLRFRDGLAELAAHGIRSYVVHGNHDPLDGWSNSIAMPPAAKVFGPAPEWASVVRDGDLIAQIQGASYATQEVRDNLAVRFSGPPDPEIFSVGLLHCNVGGNAEHDNYAPCTTADLAAIGVDYWALGHVHKRQVLRDASPTIIYAGNIQGRDPGECGPRGCYIVEVDEARTVRPEFVPLDTVRWEQVDVGVDDAGSFDGLVRRIDETLAQLRSASGGRCAVCRVVLTGHGAVHEELVRDGAVEELLQYFRDGFVADEPWVWLDAVDDRTRPTLDIEARAREADFLGLLLKKAEVVGSDPQRLGDLAREASGALKLTKSREGLAALTSDEMKALLDEARWMLAERLEGTGG